VQVTGVPASLPDAVDRGLVIAIEQWPPPGASGARRIALTAGSEVPDLKGKTSLAAAEEVSRHGLRYDPGQAPNDEWLVAWQLRPPGTWLRLGKVVTVQLAAGVVVPDLSPFNEEQAGDELDRVGLVFALDLLRDGQPPGQVVGQDPAPGTKVLPRTTVTVSVQRGPIPLPRWLSRSCAA